MIVGISGQKRSGKDLVAEYIVKKYGYVRYGLADPIKECARIIYLFDQEQLYGDKKEVIDERYGCTPREILQVMGTELFQYNINNHIEKYNVGREIWINRFFYSKMSNTDYVISDIRFKHEAEAIKKHNGIVIRLERDTGNIDSHNSENDLNDYDGFDHVVDNNKTVERLFLKIDGIINKLSRS